MAKDNNAKKIKDMALRQQPYGTVNRFGEYFNLLMNSVKIVKKGTETEMPFALQNYIKDKLFSENQIGYDSIADKWAEVDGEGRNELGYPTRLNFHTENGKVWQRKASYKPKPDGAFLIRCLPSSETTMADIIRETTDFMTNCDVAMRQNVEACKTPYIVVCRNEDILLSYKQALKQKQDGQAVVLVSEDVGEGMKSINIGVDFLAPNFRQIRNAERDDLLNKLGTMTANTDKRERLINAEASVTLGQSSDYIYTIIDTFNKQMTAYGLPWEMKFNGSMEEIYLGVDDEEEQEGNENGNQERDSY